MTYSSHLFEFCQHNHDGTVVLPEHAPEVFNSVRQRTLSGDISSALPITVYQAGINIVRAFNITKWSQAHSSALYRQDMY